MLISFIQWVGARYISAFTSIICTNGQWQIRYKIKQRQLPSSNHIIVLWENSSPKLSKKKTPASPQSTELLSGDTIDTINDKSNWIMDTIKHKGIWSLVMARQKGQYNSEMIPAGNASLSTQRLRKFYKRDINTNSHPDDGNVNAPRDYDGHQSRIPWFQQFILHYSGLFQLFITTIKSTVVH